MKTPDFDYKKFPKKINIGCGFDIKNDFLNVDLHERHGPDLVADCTDLSILPSSYYEHILANDVLEHIPRLKTRSTLREWNRLLRIDGILELQVPNVMGLLELLKRDENQNMAQHEKLLQCLYGTQAYNGDFHFIGFTEITLNGVLSETGFTLRENRIRDEWLFQAKAIKVENSKIDKLLIINGNEDFLDSMYMDLLDREPDEEGFSYYIDLLSKGFSREAIIETIKASDEYLKRNNAYK
jgi:predicted SAM-dependent methyltransferase